MTAPEGRAQVRRAVSGEKECTQDGIERCHLDIRPGPSSDRFGNYTGLVRSEASLLHRKGRHIAHGIDAEDTLHAAVVVDWDKTVGIMRKSLEIRAAKEGQGDYGIDRHLLAAEQFEAPVRIAPRVTVRCQPDALLVEEVSDEVARAYAEDAKGSPLGRDQRDLGRSCDTHMPCRHQHEVVQRQRPGDTCRNDEGKTMDRARLNPLEELSETLDVRRAAEGQSARNSLHGPRPARHEECVIRTRLSLGGAHLARPRVDRRKGCAKVSGATTLGDHAPAGNGAPS
ncbi:MAG TPA: hypothetical protein VFL41_06285 [Gaiellaceae bacterium]|nr:hypothetical protein [Gaiellaceae bacterium]